MRIRTKKSAIPALATLLLALIMPLMINQVKARYLSAGTTSAASQSIPAPLATSTAPPTPALATFGQYLLVIAAVVILAAIVVGLFIRKRKHPSTIKN
jgi:hypothetical protein